jgi:hypothetical protein
VATQISIALVNAQTIRRMMFPFSHSASFAAWVIVIIAVGAAPASGDTASAVPVD